MPIVVLVVILGVGLFVLLTVVPVVHQVPETFSIGEFNGFDCTVSPNITSAHDGNLKFSWSTNDSLSVTVYLTRIPIGPGQVLYVYQSAGATGSGNVQILTGYSYVFSTCQPPATVQITGALYYEAPLF
ncbi:MAG: hypothetical protein ACLQD9_01740 [Thermoplasmata archaeon]